MSSSSRRAPSEWCDFVPVPPFPTATEVDSPSPRAISGPGAVEGVPRAALTSRRLGRVLRRVTLEFERSPTRIDPRRE